jgi:hypothetical protein
MSRKMLTVSLGAVLAMAIEVSAQGPPQGKARAAENREQAKRASVPKTA